MIIFSLTALALILLSLLVLVRPLLKSSVESTSERQTINLQFARQRLNELADQRSNSVISDSEYKALRIEIESGLVSDLELDADTNAIAPTETTSKVSSLIIIATLCAIVPIASLGLYLIAGEPSSLTTQMANQPLSNSNAQNVQPSAATNPEIEALIAGLEAKMQQSPNDVQGWRLLASSYHQIGQFDKAESAYQHLLNLDPENADTLAALGEVTALASGGMLTGVAMEHIDRALQLNPLQPQALWLSGLAFAQQNNNVAAVEQWSKLLPLMADSPQQQQQLREIIAEANKRTGAPFEQSEQTQPASPSLSISLEISSEVSALVSPDDIVFVIAKAIDGPPAPLAVKRLYVRDLPTRVQLSDRDAMMEQLSLSRFPRVEVKARVSKSGQPIAALGDFESEPVQSANDNVNLIELLIGRAVEL